MILLASMSIVCTVILSLDLVCLASAESTAEILETKVLCKQPGKYIGWPSVAIAENGDILAVFSGDRDAHVSPDGKTQMVQSCDGGKT